MSFLWVANEIDLSKKLESIVLYRAKMKRYGSCVMLTLIAVGGVTVIGLAELPLGEPLYLFITITCFMTPCPSLFV